MSRRSFLSFSSNSLSFCWYIHNTKYKYNNYHTVKQDEKVEKFKKAVGKVISRLRKNKKNISINKLALEYDCDKGNLSKTKKGIYNIYLITAWKISEALGMKFSEFAKAIEEDLGEDFKLTDE